MKSFDCEEVQEIHSLDLIKQVIHLIGVHRALWRRIDLPGADSE